MAVEVHMLAPNGLRKQESRRLELPPTSQERPDGWVVADYGCGHSRLARLHSQDPNAARHLPGPERVRRVCGFGVEGVRIEPPAPQAAAFRGLLVGYVLRPRDKSVGRPAKTSQRSPRVAARRAARGCPVVRRLSGAT